MQVLVVSTATPSKSKRTFHERDASFSSSIQSNDSVFTDTELSSSLQNSVRFEPSELLVPESPSMGSRSSKRGSNCNDGSLNQESLSLKWKEKRCQKDSGYGSRLNTDELQSPPICSSNKSTPSSTASPTKGGWHGTSNSGHSLTSATDNDYNTLQILPLANSPTRANRSYHQFYYVGDSVGCSIPYDTFPYCNKSSEITKSPHLTPTRGKYPILPSKQLKDVHKQTISKTLKQIKSASCSSLDRLSLTSSLEEYASNLAKGDGVTPKESVDGEDRVIVRDRLLSITHFETLTADLEMPQCATVVKVSDPTPDLIQKEKKRRRNLLIRLLMGKRKQKATSLIESSEHSKGVMMTSAGEATLRRKSKRNHGRQRKVVSDDLTHKVKSQKVDKHQEINFEAVTVQVEDVKQKVEILNPESKKDRKQNSFDNTREKQFSLSAEHTSHQPELCFAQDNLLTPFSAELSQSMTGLSHIASQLRKLAQPSQSTTNLDLSQRVSETMSNVGLRGSHSVDDLTDTVGPPLSQNTVVAGDGLPREGFLWRVLGRASQRWPALIHIVPIQSSQSGMRGFGVRKGQQVRALYRVSGQVIVETDTNHLACIPYECCRISRKYYGPKSSLVELSYYQLYAPIPIVPSTTSNRSPQHTSVSPSRTQYTNTPIEMVAIQDSYNCLPLGEMNVDAGDKLRVFYCDDQRVYAVKENGEAGLLARSFCRLTRKSEKMYQKWVELTRSPFQADYPVKFNEKVPSFLTNSAFLKELGVGSKPTSQEKKSTAIGVMPMKGERKDQKQTSPVHKKSQRGIQKPLPPTPPRKRKVSPLTQNGNRSPLSPGRHFSGLVNSVSPVSRTPSMHSSPSPTKQYLLERTTAPPPNFKNEATMACSISDRSDVKICQKPMSYSGKLMTVVQNYVQNVGSPDSPIRKGLRVRVIQSSPDGKTLRVATKTGTQFDIPVSHLCMSRKNSDPFLYAHDASRFGNHDVAILANDIPNTALTFPSNHPRGKPLNATPPMSRLPLECGKIMTVIHNFTPTRDNPMVTIRRGLRVKVLGGKDDHVKVITKTGTTFTIPRSHLRLSHKTSDASAFTIHANVQAQSTPKPPSHSHNKSVSTSHPHHQYQRNDIPQNAYGSTHSSPTQTPIKERVFVTSSCNGIMHSASQQQQQRKSRTYSTPGIHQITSSSHAIHRGCRVNSTGSQVFELC